MADVSGSKLFGSAKLVLLGEAAVGKSSLAIRYVHDNFKEHKEPTIGAAFLTKKCYLTDRIVRFEIWDTAGQERFASLAPMYYRNSQAALVVYDITKASSLIKAQSWIAELKCQARSDIVIALVGSKLDLTVPSDDGDDSVEDDLDISGGPKVPRSDEVSGPALHDSDATGEPLKSNGSDSPDPDAAGEPPRSNRSDLPGPDAAGGPSKSTRSDSSGGQTDGKNNLGADPRKVTTRKAQAYADSEGLLFFETSAKTAVNVENVFMAIANAVPESNLRSSRGRGKSARHEGIGYEGRFGSRVNLTNARDGIGAQDGCTC